MNTDYIPPYFLKKHLEEFLPALTHLITLSLQHEAFATDQKVTILRHLLKKNGIDLIHSKYRTVSSLPIISKLVDKQLWNN